MSITSNLESISSNAAVDIKAEGKPVDPFPRGTHRQQRKPSQKKKKRIRLHRRGRLTWQSWLQDWLRALRSKGYKVDNEGISPRTRKLREADLKDLDVLCLHKDRIMIFLHLTLNSLSQEWPNPMRSFEKPQPKKIVHIVRGKAPDRSRMIYRTEDGNAHNIVKLSFRPPLMAHVVEFDGQLFTGRCVHWSALCDIQTVRPWFECKDEEINAIYQDYLSASPHHRSIRPYRRPSKASGNDS
jgi:hypothetical protein